MEPQTPNGVNSPASTTPSPSRPLNKKNGSSHLRSFGPGAKNNLALENLSEIAKNAVREISGEPCSARSRASEPGSARSRASSEEYNEGKSRSRSRTAQKIRKRGSSGTSSRTHRNTSLREAASAAISQLKFSAEHSDSSEGLEKDSPTQKTIQMDVPEHMRTAVATLSDSRRPGARRDRRGSRRSQAGRRGSKQYKRPVKSMLFSYNGSESGAKKKKLKEYSRLSQFQILVGVAKNDKDREMEEKMKLKNAVTLDHSTLRLFERLGVRHNVDSDSSSDNYTSGGSVSSEEHRSRYVKRRSRRRREILQQRKQNDLSKSSTSITEMGDDFYIETARSHARLRSPSPTSRQPPPSSPTAHSTQKFCSGRSPSTNAAREAHVRRSKKLALKYTRDVQSMNIFMAMVYERKQEAEKAEEMVAILAKKDLEADIQSKHVKYLESVEEREIAMVRKLSQVRQRKSTLLNRSISPKMSLKLRGGGEEGGLLKKVTAEIGIANHFAQLGAKKRVADIASGRDQSLSPNESSRNPSLLGSPLGTIAHKFRAISASISASSSPSSPPLNAVLKNISEHVPTDVGNISSLVASSDSPEPIDGGSCPFTTIVGSTVKIRSNHLKNTSERRKSSILGKLRSSRRPTHMHSHQIQARSQERADQRSARKAGREHRMKSAAKFDDFFHFDSDEDIPTDTALEQEKKRIEQASRAIDEGFGDESNSTKSDSTWGDITSSDEDELMVDIDVAQQRLLEKAMRRKSIREERVIDKGKVTAQGIMRKKAKNAEYYASMRDVVLANAQLNDQFIEAFAKNLKKFEEKYENNRRKKMEDDGYDYSPKQPTSPKASTRKRSRVNSVIRKRSFMPATNGNDSDGDDDRDNEEDILMMKNKYSPVSSLDLSNNRFSKLGTAALFDALTPVIHSINYNENDLSHSIDSVCRYLGSYRRCRLKTLKLSNTKLGNPNVVKLCKALSHNPHITALDLSNNGVNSQGCSALASLFERVRGVINLSLAWNKIDGEGSSVLFAAFSDVDSLITLDVSWNSIGTFPVPHPSQINGINALANYLHTSTSLFHLNLSANKFSMEDVAKLSTSLHNNVDIKGLHFDRNPFGKVDSKGHLVVIDEEQIKTDNQQHIHEQTKHHDEAYIGSSCWCCGQWVQVEFEFIKTYADNSKPDDEVFLRLSLDKWRKDKMTYDRGGRWYLFRMVPRILITYCFCVRTSEWSSDCYSNEQQKCFDSSAPVSTVNVVQLQDIAVGGADVDYTKHYDRERCGGTSAANTIFPFFNNILPMHINSPNCNPRGEAWAEEAGPLEEEFWCLESSKTFSVRNKENDCHTFWDVDLLYEKAFAHDWEFLIQKLGNASRIR